MTTHEFEYLIEWFFEDGFLYAREIFVTRVENDGRLEDYEVEDIARANAEEFAEGEEPDLDYEITLVDAR